MKKTKLALSLLISTMAYFANGQVKQNIVVEHFTNTNCSVCGSRNPGFYANLSQNPEIRHIAYHPSAPYSSCFFSKQNKIENDTRTSYYGIYGSTPRLVIQGTAISSAANYASATIFDPFVSKTSPIQIKTSIALKGSDSIVVSVTIINKAAHSLGNLRLFAAVVEKEINFNAPNGESKHHDVFRKSFFDPSGMPITLSGNVNDSVVYKSIVYKNVAWVNSNLYAVAILNKETDKSLVQTEQSGLLNTASGLNNWVKPVFDIYPNPTSNSLTIDLQKQFIGDLRIHDFTGKIVKEQINFGGGELDVSNLQDGIYFIQIEKNNQVHSLKFIKQH